MGNSSVTGSRDLLKVVDVVFGFNFQHSCSIWKLEIYYAIYQYPSELCGTTFLLTWCLCIYYVSISSSKKKSDNLAHFHEACMHLI